MTPSPTNARHVVTAFAVTLAVITYVDRVAIAVAAPFITQDLGLSRTQMGWALFAFGWAYALFEIPGGWLGDRIGSRRVLMRIVIWWSAFTAATGWAWSAISLVVIRALFGAGEAGAFPNLTRILTTWLPVKERERAQATLWLATRVSGAFTPVIIALSIGAIGWRHTFEVCGLLGVVLPLVPGQSGGASRGQRGGARAPPSGEGHGYRARGSALGTDLLHAVGLAAVDSVHVPRLRMVVLYQLASHLPA
jgi:ACS family glucarate transporter-like MFS transporter